MSGATARADEPSQDTVDVPAVDNASTADPGDGSSGLPDIASLREMLLASEQRRSAAEASRHRADLVLGGLRILSTTLGGEEVLGGVLEIIGGVVQYRAAAVLVEPADGNKAGHSFEVLLATGSSTPFHILQPDRFTSRVLDGRATVISDLAQIPGLDILAEEPFGHRTALFTPIRTADRKGMLICLADEVGGYSHHDLEIVSQIGPLVSQAIRRFDEDRRIAELMAQLDQLAHTDALTGLANRVQFEERLQERVDRHRVDGTPFALLQIDVDGLKLVNDAYGHQAGDRLIKATADAIGGVTRPSDLCARLGGDEFGVILHQGDPLASAHHVAERITAALATDVSAGTTTLRPQVSIGIGLCGRDQNQPERTAEYADRAMYRAKSSDVSNVVVFDAERHGSWLDSGDIGRELDTPERLRIHYQPIAATTTGVVTAYDARLQWHHPRHGLLEGERLLGDLAGVDLIARLGRLTWDTALAAAGPWLRGGSGRRITVGLAVRQILVADLVPDLLASIGRADLEPGHVEIGLGSAPVAERRRHAFDVALSEIRDAGVGITYPSLGVGPSTVDRWLAAGSGRVALDHRQAPVTAVGDQRRALLRAGHGYAAGHGLRSVLVGVDSDEHLGWARAIGIDEVQGRLVGPPTSRPGEDGATHCEGLPSDRA